MTAPRRLRWRDGREQAVLARGGRSGSSGPTWCPTTRRWPSCWRWHRERPAAATSNCGAPWLPSTAHPCNGCDHLPTPPPLEPRVRHLPAAALGALPQQNRSPRRADVCGCHPREDKEGRLVPVRPQRRLSGPQRRSSASSISMGSAAMVGLRDVPADLLMLLATAAGLGNSARQEYWSVCHGAGGLWCAEEMLFCGASASVRRRGRPPSTRCARAHSDRRLGALRLTPPGGQIAAGAARNDAVSIHPTARTSITGAACASAARWLRDSRRGRPGHRQRRTPRPGRDCRNHRRHPCPATPPARSAWRRCWRRRASWAASTSSVPTPHRDWRRRARGVLGAYLSERWPTCAPFEQLAAPEWLERGQGASSPPSQPPSAFTMPERRPTVLSTLVHAEWLSMTKRCALITAGGLVRWGALTQGLVPPQTATFRPHPHRGRGRRVDTVSRGHGRRPLPHPADTDIAVSTPAGLPTPIAGEGNALIPPLSFRLTPRGCRTELLTVTLQASRTEDRDHAGHRGWPAVAASTEAVAAHSPAWLQPRRPPVRRLQQAPGRAAAGYLCGCGCWPSPPRSWWAPRWPTPPSRPGMSSSPARVASWATAGSAW